MNPRALSDEQEAALASSYLAGATYEVLAASYGCSHGTVQNALRRQGVPRRTRTESAASRKVLAPEVEQQVADEYRAGATFEALAGKFGCSPVTVRNILLRLEVPTRPSGRQPLPRTSVKKCSSCGTTAPRADFDGGGVRTSECSACRRAKNIAKYQADPEYRKARVEANRRRRSGWGLGQFEAMWQTQGGKCAICAVPMARQGKGPTSVHADHDHETGVTRSLLCAHCNRMLGFARDNPQVLQAAARYVASHKEVSLGI